MEAKDYLQNGKVHIWKADFAIVKANKINENAFANITDKREITQVIDQTKFRQEDVIETDKNWKLLTFDMEIPFELVGFLSLIAQEMAAVNVSIYALSAFTTDHVLVKKENLNTAKEVLEKLGCKLIEH